MADAVVEQEGVRAWTDLERTGYGAWRARPQGRDGPEASGLHGREVDERGVRRRKEGERGGRGRGPHRRLQGHMGVEARGRPVGRRTGTIDGDGRRGSRGRGDPGGWLRRLDLQAAAIGVEGGSGMLPRSRSDREGGERRGEWGWVRSGVRVSGMGDKGSGVAGWAFWAGGLLASWAIRPRGREFFLLFYFSVDLLFIYFFCVFTYLLSLFSFINYSNRS